VKSLSEAHPDFGFASGPVDVQWYVEGSAHAPVPPSTRTSCHCWLRSSTDHSMQKSLCDKQAYLKQAVTYQTTDIRIGFLVSL
jgi:hypothetical protein